MVPGRKAVIKGKKEMIEAEKAQHLWFAVGFLWILSIVIAFFLAKIIKTKSINIDHIPPNMDVNMRHGLPVDPNRIKYDFPTQQENPEDEAVTKALYEAEKAEEYRKNLEIFNRSIIRDDVKDAAERIEGVLKDNPEEAVRERVTLTIITTKEAMSKLEEIKKRSGKSYSRIITEKIIVR